MGAQPLRPRQAANKMTIFVLERMVFLARTRASEATSMANPLTASECSIAPRSERRRPEERMAEIWPVSSF